MSIKKFLSLIETKIFSVTECLRINLIDFDKNSPILIYQMGKVGSSTVYATIKKAMPYKPLYQIHFLSDEGVNSAERYFNDYPEVRTPNHLITSKLLRKKMAKNKNVLWKVITLFREPIGREISDFFQVVHQYHTQCIDKDGDVNVPRAMEFLQNKFENYDGSTSYTSTWFDKEIKQTFGIDVFDYPFNHDDGFMIINNHHVGLLLLRLEGLSRSFKHAIRAFLDPHNNFELQKSNIGEDKEYGRAYEAVLKNISIPKATCLKIYSTKYARHFYTEEMRSTFIKRWSNK